MTELKDRIEDVLSLVEQNFEFFHVGMFFDDYAKRNDLSSKVVPIELSLEDEKVFRPGDIVKDSLRDYFIKDRSTVFGYMVAWNAFRGIGMAMKEGLQDNPNLKDFIKKKLGNRYEHYHAILSFIRNVLSHNIHDETQLKEQNYKDTRTYFVRDVCSTGVATLSINYADDFPGTNLPSGYGFNLEVNFNLLNPGKRFIEVISESHLYMFSELCFILVKAFRNEAQPS